MTEQPTADWSSFVADNVSAMLAYWDANQICRFANKAYFDWYGRSPAGMIGRLTLSELLGRDYPKFVHRIRRALNGNMQIFERHITQPGGQDKTILVNLIPHIENGQVKGFFTHAADVTLLKTLEETKRLAEEHRSIFEAFMQNSPLPAWITDQNGIMQYMNPACKQAIHAEEFPTGQSIFDLFPAHLAATYFENNRIVLEKGQALTANEEATDPIDGVQTYHSVKFPLRYNNEWMVAGWSVNITEQERLHESVIHLKEQKRKEMLRSVIETQEREREIISRQLREEITQTLASCKIMIENSRPKKNVDPVLPNVALHIQRAIEALYWLSSNLSPTSITDLGFLASLEDYMDRWQSFYQIAIRFSCSSPEVEQLGIENQMSIFRILQQLIKLLSTHPSIQILSVEMGYEFPELRLSIRHNDPLTLLPRLDSAFIDIQNRIEYYNGSLEECPSNREMLIELILIVQLHLDSQTT